LHTLVDKDGDNLRVVCQEDHGAELAHASRLRQDAAPG
jgi:hypothetical protein